MKMVFSHHVASQGKHRQSQQQTKYQKPHSKKRHKTLVGNRAGKSVLFITFGQFLDHDVTEIEMNPCTQRQFGM